MQLQDALFGEPHAALAFEMKRLGDNPDCENAEFAGCLGNHRRGAGPGASSHARGDKHHVGARQMIADFVHHLLGRRAANVGLRAGAEALGGLHAHLNDAFGPRGG